MTPDDILGLDQPILTRHRLVALITEAPSTETALQIANAAPKGIVWAAANLLYIDTYQHGIAWVRRALVPHQATFARSMMRRSFSS